MCKVLSDFPRHLWREVLLSFIGFSDLYHFWDSTTEAMLFPALVHNVEVKIVAWSIVKRERNVWPADLMMLFIVDVMQPINFTARQIVLDLWNIFLLTNTRHYLM